MLRNNIAWSRQEERRFRIQSTLLISQKQLTDKLFRHISNAEHTDSSIWQSQTLHSKQVSSKMWSAHKPCLQSWYAYKWCIYTLQHVLLKNNHMKLDYMVIFTSALCFHRITFCNVQYLGKQHYVLYLCIEPREFYMYQTGNYRSWANPTPVYGLCWGTFYRQHRFYL